jgi:hypothetical protein
MQFLSVWLQIKIYIAAKSIRSYTAISKLFMIVLLSYATVEVDPASSFDVPGQLPSSRYNWITSVLRPPLCTVVKAIFIGLTQNQTPSQKCQPS